MKRIVNGNLNFIETSSKWESKWIKHLRVFALGIMFVSGATAAFAGNEDLCETRYRACIERNGKATLEGQAFSCDIKQAKRVLEFIHSAKDDCDWPSVMSMGRQVRAGLGLRPWTHSSYEDPVFCGVSGVIHVACKVNRMTDVSGNLYDWRTMRKFLISELERRRNEEPCFNKILFGLKCE